MKNKLIDLNNHLFAQMERLTDEDLKDTSLIEEINRSKAVSSVAGQIIANAKLALDAEIALTDRVIGCLPKMIGANGDKKEV